MTPEALVLLSGGQDSCTCLAIALEKHGSKVKAIAFDYGQRHQIELKQAQILADIAQVELTIIDLSFIPKLSKNALTDESMSIQSTNSQWPNTFVPGRNLFFLSTAAVWAYQHEIRALYTGVCQTDFSGYPDCREEFIQSASQSISLALAEKMTIETPLMYLTKAQTVKRMQGLGRLEWYQHTHTCYEGQRPACGQCPACLLRLKGFEEAGVKDPLPYAC